MSMNVSHEKLEGVSGLWIRGLDRRVSIAKAQIGEQD